MRNINADTTMREKIGGGGDQKGKGE
jgi:hypothetical protein